jgi:hypothetical protein
MKIPSDKVKVKIKTDSFIVRGLVHTTAGGRLSDYMTAHVKKFIPVTEAEITPIDSRLENEKEKREVVFINVEKIEMIEYL